MVTLEVCLCFGCSIFFTACAVFLWCVCSLLVVYKWVVYICRVCRLSVTVCLVYVMFIGIILSNISTKLLPHNMGNFNSLRPPVVMSRHHAETPSRYGGRLARLS